MVNILKLNPITGKLDLVLDPNSLWVFNITPTGTVNGTNTTFVLPADASDVIVYADGMRASEDDYTLTDDTIEFVSGRQPYSSISADYLPA